eukprot:Colp12_sorted_trinity150504_noHs@31922
MLEAAEALECPTLLHACQARMGAFESRVRDRTWQEVLDAVDQGQLWLLINGMVLDVTKWINQHPGGRTIIPRQAVRCDATYWFEIYHASRESFLYLKQFYIGELVASDLPLVPPPRSHGHTHTCSADFRAQLQAYTSWRKQIKHL